MSAGHAGAPPMAMAASAGFCDGQPSVMDMAGFSQRACVALLFSSEWAHLNTRLRYALGWSLSFALALFLEYLRPLGRRLSEARSAGGKGDGGEARPLRLVQARASGGLPSDL